MRSLLSRKLSASGYTIGARLKLRGVEATCLEDRRGNPILLISSSIFGPSWAQIYKALEHLVPAPVLLNLGNTPVILTEDSPSARSLIGAIHERAKVDRKKEVYLEGVGFVPLDTEAKLELKKFIFPAISVALVIALGIFWSASESTNQAEEELPDLQNCVAEMSSTEFENWLSQTLNSEVVLSGGIRLQEQTELGQLNIVVESTIGSAAKVTGSVTCADGRERLVNHRIDASGEGAVFELGS
jgi:hypothetical protein